MLNEPASARKEAPIDEPFLLPRVDFKALQNQSTPSQLRVLLRILNRPLAILLAPAGASLAASVCEMISIGLLIPALQGFLEGKVSNSKTFFFRFLPEQWVEVNTSNGLLMLLLIIFAASVMKNVFSYVGMSLTHYQVRQMSRSLQDLIFYRYLHFGKSFLDKVSFGRLQGILMQYTGEIANTLPLFQTLVSAVFLLTTYLILLFTISWQLTFITILGLPLVYYSLNWLKKKISASSRAHVAHLGKINQKVSNTLGCIPLIRTCSMEKEEKTEFGHMTKRLAQAAFSIDKKHNLVAPAVEILTLSLLLLLVVLVPYLLTHAGTSILLVYFLILRKAMSVFNGLSGFAPNFAKVSGHLSDIFEILDDGDKAYVPNGTVEFPGLKRAITFNQLNFSYGGGSSVLKNLSFKIRKGDMTAIVGPTGVGKTTIINLIQRLYDCEPGGLLIDGVDIREISLTSLRAHMAVVSQDPLLFNDTFRKNVTYGVKREISDPELDEALKQARLFDFVAQLPQRLETPIGERGIKLSGGEKQRVSIARAILRRAEILILDEATSALDTYTEKLIQEALEKVVQNKTSIVIAHRLSTILRAGKIIVIESGTVAEEGQLEELLKKQSIFYRYWQHQKFV